MHFFRFALCVAILICLYPLTAQLSLLPSSDHWNSDTAYARSATSAAWRGNQVSAGTAGLSGIPELREGNFQAYWRHSNNAFGFSSLYNGTDFFRHSRLSFSAAHKAQHISAGINLIALHYYAREYYSVYRGQCDLHTLARLRKGKTWFSMHLNNLLPSRNQKLMQDPMQLSLSVSHRIFHDLRIGVQQKWFNKHSISHSAWVDLRWNRYLSTVFSYHLKERFTNVGLRFFYRRHSWQNTATLFYNPGFLWSCAYSYSW